MKNSLHIFFTSILLICYSYNTDAQNEDKRIAVSIHTGLGIMQGDGQTGSPGLNFGAGFKYSLANNFSLRAQLYAGSLSATNLQDTALGNIYVTTTTFYEGNIQALLNVVNFKKRSTGRNFAQLYMGIGIGYTFANINYPAFRPQSEPLSVQTFNIPFTIGLRFYINPLIDFGVEYNIKETFTDNLEGCNPYTSNNKSNDYYNTPNVYVNFNLGRNKTVRNIEWTEQTERLNEELVRVNKENQQKMAAMQKELNARIIEVQHKADSAIFSFKKEYHKDSDSDGVADYFDKEPNTPRGAIVDGSGRTLNLSNKNIQKSPEKDPVVPEKNSPDNSPSKTTTTQSSTQLAVVSEGVKNLQFETSSAIILSPSFPALDALAKMLIDNPSVHFLIEGYTDNIGDPTDNITLSQNRAEAVKSYIVSKGVDEKRITAKGYGDTKPVASNETPEGRAQNRRVDMRVE